MDVSHLYSMLLLIRCCVYGVRIVVSADAWSSVDYCSGRADCLAFLLPVLRILAGGVRQVACFPFLLRKAGATGK